MARYIDADKAMQEVERMGNHGLSEWSTLGVKALINRQPTADVVPRAEWISVEERLPESLQRVLVIDTKGDMFTSVYISFATGKNAWSTQNSYLGDVTHWMPLPEPPKTD